MESFSQLVYPSMDYGDTVQVYFIWNLIYLLPLKSFLSKYTKLISNQVIQFDVRWEPLLF